MEKGPTTNKGSLLYVPKVDTDPSVRSDQEALPEPPNGIGPIFDEAHALQPIEEYDDTFQRTNYYSDSSVVPPKPKEFDNQYLFPTLTQNERLRLTMSWYYTRGITEDKELLQKLSGMVKMVQQFMGWEFAIMGMLDEAVYTRLVTVNLPLAILPRRESTCSHTINQPPGSVFMLTNMLEDWRFAKSPHVDIGGLRSYAGTALRLKTEDGEEVVLGSLCVASDSAQEPLTSEKLDILRQFASILVAEVVSRMRRRRQKERQSMTDLLSKLQSQANSAEDIKGLAIGLVKQEYPEALVTIQKAHDDMLTLENRTPIRISDFCNELWEDSQYIETAIKYRNFQRLQSSQTVRVIASKCGNDGRFLVVASRNVQFVFDDVDSWFISSCASIIAAQVQERKLQEALIAKEQFLRGITHQLRTPIHGILGSAELLAEELASRDLLNPTYQQRGSCSSSYLATIRNSGRELMSTVNNMLKLSKWADSTPTSTPTVYDLDQLEDDILTDVSLLIAEEELADVSIVFKNQLATGRSIVTTDVPLLKECIQSLVLNALQATTRGSITVIISMGENRSTLCFDVTDTGCGIKPKDQQRIFDSYEKVNVHTRGAGLGLTIAAKIAKVMDGSIKLVTSTEGMGSHFRAELYNPVLACPIESPKPIALNLQMIPKAFYVVPDSTVPSALLSHLCNHLKQRGFVRNQDPQGAVILVEGPRCQQDVLSSLPSLNGKHVIIYVGLNHDNPERVLQAFKGQEVVFPTGPFFTSRLDELLRQVDQLYKSIVRETSQVLQSTDSMAFETCEFPTHTKVQRSLSECIPPEQKRCLRALLVDDNVINLRILRMYCEKRNIPYITAADGNEAVAKFKAALAADDPISLTLMDLQMPNCDGIEACAQIRELEIKEGLKPSIVFMVTGQDSADDKTRSFDAGATEFFVKPVSLKTIDQGVARHFEDHTVSAC